VNALLRANIHQAFARLAQVHPMLDASEVFIIGDGSTVDPLMMRMARNLLAPLPWFRRENGAITSPQTPYFGFYALRAAVRAVFLAASFLGAGFALRKEHLLSPAVSMLYTAAFHALGGFLALQGRVVVESVLGPVEVYSQPNGAGLSHGTLPGRHPEMMLAKVTNGNSWVFEPRSRAHRWRWLEVLQASKESHVLLPDYFQAFFAYVDSYGPDDMDSGEAEVLGRISELRHKALYASFGLDDFAIDAVLNGESNGGGTGLRADGFLRFASALTLDVAKQANELLNTVEVSASTKNSLVASIITPLFDPPFMKDIEDSHLKQEVDALVVWAFVRDTDK
jgi:hypothetical protein